MLPVWMSCREIVPGPVVGDVGCVAQRISSWRCTIVVFVGEPFLSASGVVVRGEQSRMKLRGQNHLLAGPLMPTPSSSIISP